MQDEEGGCRVAAVGEGRKCDARTSLNNSLALQPLSGNHLVGTFGLRHLLPGLFVDAQ